MHDVKALQKSRGEDNRYDGHRDSFLFAASTTAAAFFPLPLIVRLEPLHAPYAAWHPVPHHWIPTPQNPEPEQHWELPQIAPPLYGPQGPPGTAVLGFGRADFDLDFDIEFDGVPDFELVTVPV